MPPKSDIEAIDRPTVLSILYSTISAQQMNLQPENGSQNDAIFPKGRYGIYQTTSQCLSSYGCTIIVIYDMVQCLTSSQCFYSTGKSACSINFRTNTICYHHQHVKILSIATVKMWSYAAVFHTICTISTCFLLHNCVLGAKNSYNFATVCITTTVCS